MTALEEIKKALKKVYIAEWYISGVKTNGLSVVHNAADSSMFGITAETFEAEYIAAVNPAAISELLSTIESLQRENEELRRDLSHEASHRQKLQNALAYWMPGVTKEIEISTNGRCGDDALLLVGSEGPFDDKCWGNEAIARAEAAEAEVKRLREALHKTFTRADGGTFVWGQSADMLKQRVGFLEEDIRDIARTALASTGGEHHAE